MNERIKELYNQSGGLVRMYEGKLTYFPAYQKNVGDGNFEFSSFDPEKFAELIVRECAQFIDEENIRLCEYQNSLPEWDGNKRDDCDLVIEKCVDLADKIKEHFGVEE